MNYKEDLQKEYIETLQLIKGLRATKRPEDYGLKLKALLEILKSIEKQMEVANNVKPRVGR